MELFCLILFCQSCASFIDNPSKLKKWEYKEKSSCPKIYRTTTNALIDYYNDGNHFYTCQIKLDGTNKVSCKKHLNYFPFYSEKSFTHLHEKILKDNGEKYSCTIASASDADFEINIKIKSMQNFRTPWMFASMLSLGLIPYRTTTQEYKTFEIMNLKTHESKIVHIDSATTFWMQLFLLPAMPFVGEDKVNAKILAHENSLIFEVLESLDRSENQSQVKIK